VKIISVNSFSPNWPLSSFVESSLLAEWETQGTDSRAGAASGLAKTGQKQAVIA